MASEKKLKPSKRKIAQEPARGELRTFKEAEEQSEVAAMNRQVEKELSRELNDEEKKLVARVEDAERRGLLCVTVITKAVIPNESSSLTEETKSLVRELINYAPPRGLLPRAMPYVSFQMLKLIAY
jgi:Skp family chaperone for outer membrane proteins